MKKFFLLFFAAGLCSFSIFAIDIEVADVDLELPLEGVTITSGELKTQTNVDGTAAMNLPPGRQRLVFSLPGYDTTAVTVESDQNKLFVKMRIATVLEGQELVVEKAVPLQSDTQSGVSVAISEREMEATAQMGIVEDVMSAIKTLPGVTYAGGWNAMPSIRGGSPYETTVVLDGFEVTYPYHWGGAFSIFNPNMVESAKLSAGLVSARYGRLISGLLEVNSKTPKTPELRWDASLTTSGAEAFVQTPLGKNAGLLVGGKVTWLEVSLGMAGGVDAFTQVPFIRDAYSKFFWTPDERFTVYLNTFLGSDGVGAAMDSEGDHLTTKGDFDWINLLYIVSGGAKWLPSDNLYFHLLGGWSRQEFIVDFDSTYSGDIPYSQAFLDIYDGSSLDLDGTTGTINGKSTFNLDGMYYKFDEKEILDVFQGRSENQWMFAQGQSLVFGVDGLFEQSSVVDDLEGYQDISEGGVDKFIPVSFTVETDANKVLNSGAFFLWDFAFDDDAYSGELGVRLDHAYLWNDDISIQTWPVANPRMRLKWTPTKDSGDIKSLSFTAGAGLYSKLPYFSRIFEERYGIGDFEFAPDRAVFGLVGTEIHLFSGWKISLEGYYKYYFQRTYLTEVPDSHPVELEINDDGMGFATGFDLMLQKKESRWIDGYLTYSFVYARYYNPHETDDESDTASDGSPLGRWYYPSFHRFHSLNLITNFKPTSKLTFTVKASVASGAPRDKIGEAEPYAAVDINGQVIERWKRSSSYSDTLRDDWSCPVDLKVTFSDYYQHSKIRWEYYFGIENVFANLYSPKTNKAIDSFTGEELSGSGEADFTIGVPIPSFGFKLSY